MKSRILLGAVFAFAALYVMRCTSAVAPKHEGTTKAFETDESSTDTKTDTKNPADTIIDTSTATGMTDTDTSTEDTDTSTEVAEAAAIGEISDVETDIEDFNPKSVYGIYTAAPSKSLMITITTTKVTEDSLKEVEKYECKDCQSTDDPNCKDADTGTTDSISIIFSASADANKKVDENGFPKEDTIEKTGLTDDSSTTISWTSHAAEFQNTGTIAFKAGSRPTAADDDFELDVDITMQGGKTYKAHLKSRIITFPDNPTPPTCEDDQYLHATYK